MKTRLKEAELAKGTSAMIFRSKIAEYIVLNKDMDSRENVRLVSHISDTRKLDVLESLEIYKIPKVELLKKDQGARLLLALEIHQEVHSWTKL